MTGPAAAQPDPEKSGSGQSGLAHGATGIFYFMYSSHLNDNRVADFQGLVDGNYRITPKWTEVQSLNRMLQDLDDTLLRLTSDAVFAGDAPASFVQRLSDRPISISAPSPTPTATAT